MQNKFSYPLKLEDMGSSFKHYDFQADAEELKLAADILQIPALLSFDVRVDVKFNKSEHMVILKGHINALAEQTSVVSLKTFKRRYKIDFERFFDSQLTLAQQRELEDFEDINADIPDVMVDGKIDLKEIALEELALNLEDFPRQKGEEFIFNPDFDIDEDKPNNPFEVLKKLKKS